MRYSLASHIRLFDSTYYLELLFRFQPTCKSKRSERDLKPQTRCVQAAFAIGKTETQTRYIFKHTNSLSLFSRLANSFFFFFFK